MTGSQIALGLKVRDDNTLSNYCGEGNRDLLLSLHAAANGRGERFIYFWGVKGVGKTHLLQACCHGSNKLGLMTLYLPLGNLKSLKTGILDNLESLHLVCVDDIQGIASHSEWEEAFFNFFNRLQAAGKRLIIAGNAPPQKLNIQLPDLVSRLTGGTVFQVSELSEQQKIDALIMRAQAMGLIVTLPVAEFLIRRLNRDLGSLFTTLIQLDQASLEAKRKLTIPFIKSVLGI